MMMEVWLAYLRFADHPDVGKVRPVIIIDTTPGGYVVLKVTTASPHEPYRYCELKDWGSEGLVKPSRAQVDPLFVLSINDRLNNEPLGVLSHRDHDAIRRALEGSIPTERLGR